MGKIKNILLISILVFIVAYYIPIPHRIQAQMPAVLYNENGHYVFSFNARRHNYLLKQDCIIPEIKVYSEDETVFSFEDIDFSMYKDNIPVEDIGDISVANFFYYADDTKDMEPVSLDYSEKKNCFILKTDEFTCIAPAENDEDVREVIQYFKDNNLDTGLE